LTEVRVLVIVQRGHCGRILKRAILLEERKFRI